MAMSRRRVARLADECLSVTHEPTSDPYAVQVRPECFEWMRDAGHPVESIENVYNGVSVKERQDNAGYLVMEIETLEYPIDIADAAEDGVTLWVCSCPDYHYRRFPNLSDGERPSEAGECSHIEKVRRKERKATEPEEGQADLGEVQE